MFALWFYHRKIPFNVLCNLAHTCEGISSTWAFFCLNIYVIGITTYGATKRRRQRRENWCNSTKIALLPFAVVYCSVCCRSRVKFLGKQFTPSFLMFGCHWNSLWLRKPTDHCSCPRGDIHPSFSQHHIFIPFIMSRSQCSREAKMLIHLIAS